MKSLNTWKLISESLKQDVAVMLLYVIASSGSSPGRPGFMMAVNVDGKMEGSLGGGIMEHKFIELAKSTLHQKTSESSIHKQAHNKNASSHQSGMICSGEQTILLYIVHRRDGNYIDAIIRCLEQYNHGLLQLSPAGINFLSVFTPGINEEFTMNSDDDWIYSEIIGYKNRLYIIGGGHCALALSRIMRLMDFYIHVFDERVNLNTMLQNEFAHEKEVLEDYTMLSERIQSGKDHYIVIMTFGYRTDATALKALLNKDFKYVGLLGSSAKIKSMFAGLSADGVEPQHLKKIHAPVGIPINSHTPEEVAVSIAAEIIKVKNDRD